MIPAAPFCTASLAAMKKNKMGERRWKKVWRPINRVRGKMNIFIKSFITV
jgi:hypothetical protein